MARNSVLNKTINKNQFTLPTAAWQKSEMEEKNNLASPQTLFPFICVASDAAAYINREILINKCSPLQQKLG